MSLPSLRRVVSRHRSLLLGAAALAALVLPGAAVAATPVSIPFTAPGETPFVVPAGVHQLQVVAVGGKGGTGEGAAVSGEGGFGARVTGTVAVTPGQIVYVEVGANGASGTAAPGSAVGGGGAGGAGGPTGATGGGGGGASGFQTAASASPGGPASRLIVAAGGGGSGGAATTGNGGGAAGVAGAAGTNLNSGGGGATTTAGGTAGAGIGTGGTAAEPGASALGGAGALGGAVTTASGGGGGGGGYFGGGGGGSVSVGSGGGGGGGASFSAPSVIGAVTQPDTSGTPSVTLNYSAVAIASLSPGGLIFPAQLVGTTSAADVVTVTNTGTEPLTVTRIGLTGHVTDFSAQSECTAAVAPGASCRLVVLFTPRAAGTRVATLTVDSNAVDASVRVLLTGLGTEPPPPPPPPPPPRPAISALAVSPSAFAAARRGGPVVTNPVVGTRISYRANVGFTSTFTVQRATPGVRSGARCLPRPRRVGRTAQGCVRWVNAGNFSTTARAGVNSLRFSGRVAGRTLAPGSYRFVVVPRSGAQTGNAVRVGFRVR